MQYTNMLSTHWNHKNILLISWDYPFKDLEKKTKRRRQNYLAIFLKYSYRTAFQKIKHIAFTTTHSVL
jgi:hypothetical protein